MPLPGESGFAPRIRTTVVLERGRAGQLRQEYRSGADMVPPASGTVSLIASPSGAVVFTKNVVAADDDAAVADYDAEDLPASLAFGSGYRIVWDVTPTGQDHPVQTAVPAMLARYALHCPVTQADLEGEYPDLAAQLNTTSGNLVSFIDGAWAEVLQRLLAAGQWPDAIVDVDQLAEPVKNFALSKFLRFASVTLNREDLRRWAEDHERLAVAAWGRVAVRRDTNQDGTADSEDRSPPTQPLVRSAPRGQSYARPYRGRSPF